MTPRSNSDSYSAPGNGSWSCSNSSGVYSSGDYTSEGYSKESFFNGYDIDRYHFRRKKGELLPMTPFEKFTTTSHGLRSYEISYPTGNSCKGSGHGVSWITNVDSGDLEFIADKYFTDHYVQAAAARIYENGHDTLTFLVELRKAIDMFKGVLRRLLSILSNFDNLAKSWLEYRYGWRTLYFDVVDIVEVISELNDNRTRFRQNSGNRFHHTVDTEFLGFEGAFGKCYVTTHDSFDISVRGSVVADIDPPEFRFNLALTAWETVKYSFIVDWIINIGQWLAANSFLSLSDQHSSAAGIKVKLDRTISTRLELASGCSGWMDVDAAATATYWRRTPTPVSTLPQFNINLDVQKIIDLLAILYRKI